MSQSVQNLFMALGAALVIVGVLVLIFKPTSGDNSMKIFGQEVHISAPGLVVIVLGCVMFAAPFLIPMRATSESNSQTAAPRAAPAAQMASLAPESPPSANATEPARAHVRRIRDGGPLAPQSTPPQHPDPMESSTSSERTASVSSPPLCKSGYVWREARPTDYVCVTPDVRTRTKQENQSAASLVDPAGAYGPSSCKSGYVWREAYSGDVVCVTPATRDLVGRENGQGPNHVEQ